MITRDIAYRKVNELISNQNLVKHCLAVEATMIAYAFRFKQSEDEVVRWGVAGLIHDADWEKFPEKHPQVVIDWLKEIGEDDVMQNAIAAHGFNFNIDANSLMAKTLRAVDELTGLIIAVTLVRESKKLSEVTVESVLKKWNISSFAKGVNRLDIEKGAAEIFVPLEEHIEVVLKAMQSISDKLGL